MNFFSFNKSHRKNGDPSDPKRLRRNPLVWIAVVLAVVLYGLYDGKLTDFSKIEEQRSIPAADVGGPFNLINQDGQVVTEKDFKGQFMLVYFGYTWCPDVCPIDVLVMTEVIEMLGDDGTKVQPIFITVDPKRDTVSSLAQFVTHFHPRLIALTGSEENIQAAASAYKVYFSKGDSEEAGDDYLIGHTTFMYLMGPDGVFLEFFQQGQEPTEIARSIGSYL